MSVTKQKTLAQVRTFAQDFKEHQNPNDAAMPVTGPPKKGPVVKVTKSPGPKKKAEKKKEAHIVAKTKAKKDKRQKKAEETLKSILDHATNEDHKTTTPKAAAPKIRVQKSPAAKKQRVNVGAPAQVISSTKKSTGRASQRSFFGSLGEWFNNLFTPKTKTPTYTVQDTERRKGVIKKATTKSGTIFTADNETLREEILRRRKKEEHEIDVTWTPNTDPGYNLLEGEHVEEWSEVAAKKKLPEPEIIEPTPAKPVVEEPVLPPQPTPEPEAPVPIAPPIEPEPVPEQTAPVAPPVELEPEEPAPVVERPKVEPFAALRSMLKGRTEDVNTNALAIGLLAVVAAVFILVLIVRGAIGLLTPDETIVPNEQFAPLIIGLETSNYQLEATDANTLEGALDNTAMIVTSATEEVVFTSSDGARVSPQELVVLLDLRINPNLSQSIQDLRLVVVDTVQHALVFTVSDSFTALGGMLEWEERMADDLSDTLNTVSVPEASASFVDETYNDIDMRVLTDGIDDVLVYGFIDEDTVLITKTTETFERLAN
jgi:hypothetical protein